MKFNTFAVCDNVQRQPVVPPLIYSHSFPHSIGNYSLKNPVAFAFVNDWTLFRPDHSLCDLRLDFLGNCFIFDF